VRGVVFIVIGLFLSGFGLKNSTFSTKSRKN